MDTEKRVQILDETKCISHGVNTLEKKYESNFYPSSREYGVFNLVMATGLGESKLWIQTS